MSDPTVSSYWNQTTPAVPSGDQACVVQTDNATPQDSRTIYPQRMVGDSGSGGKAGTVPPPAAGDGAAKKWLKATGAWLAIVASDLAGAVFGASGAGHSVGAVPDPGASAGTTRYLREDATWAAPAVGILLQHDGTNNGSQTTLDAKAGTGIAITDDGVGGLTFAVQNTAQPVIRGTSTGGSTSASSFTASLTSLTPPGGGGPVSAQAGDFALAFSGGAWSFVSVTPSGWTLVYDDNTGANSTCYSKTLTSGDISTGTVTMTRSNTYAGTVTLIVFVGATGGIREIGHSNFTGSSTTRTLSTSSAVLSSDAGVLFSTTRNSSGASLSTSPGTSLQNPFFTDVESRLYDYAMPGGVTTFSFTDTTPGANFTYGFVIVEGVTTVGSGSVTSVAMTVPSWLTATVTNPTAAVTAAITATTGQPANEFLATPDGATGPVGLRTVVATDIPVGGVSAKTVSYTAVAADTGKLISFNSASAVTLTLPAAAPNAKWNIEVANIGAGTLTISPNSLNLDGSASSITLATNQGIYISTDATNYFSSRGAGGAGSGVSSLNSLTGALSIVAGTNVTVTPSGSNITIASTGGGGSGSGLFAPLISAVPTQSSTGLTTAFNQTGTFTATDTAVGITLADSAAAAADHVEGLTKAYPGVAFTVSALLSIPYPYATLNSRLGIFAATSTSGKIMSLDARFESTAGEWAIHVTEFSSFTTGVAHLYSSTTLLHSPYIWLRYKDDGTNIYFSVSTDGAYWQQVYTVSKAGSYLGSSGFNLLGLMIDPFGAVGTTCMAWNLTTP